MQKKTGIFALFYVQNIHQNWGSTFGNKDDYIIEISVKDCTVAPVWIRLIHNVIFQVIRDYIKLTIFRYCRSKFSNIGLKKQFFNFWKPQKFSGRPRCTKAIILRFYDINGKIPPDRYWWNSLGYVINRARLEGGDRGWVIYWFWKSEEGHLSKCPKMVFLGLLGVFWRKIFWLHQRKKFRKTVSFCPKMGQLSI